MKPFTSSFHLPQGLESSQFPMCCYFFPSLQDAALNQALKVLETNLSTQATPGTHMEPTQAQGNHLTVKSRERAERTSGLSPKETKPQCQASVSRCMVFPWPGLLFLICHLSKPYPPVKADLIQHCHPGSLTNLSNLPLPHQSFSSSISL